MEVIQHTSYNTDSLLWYNWKAYSTRESARFGTSHLQEPELLTWETDNNNIEGRVLLLLQDQYFKVQSLSGVETSKTKKKNAAGTIVVNYQNQQ